MVTLITWITLLSIIVIIYHHVGYPLLLILLRKFTHNITHKTSHQAAQNTTRQTSKKHHDKKNKTLSITIVMPAYNEAEFIDDKIKNLACLDYPENYLHIIIATDGCTDNTVNKAHNALHDPMCKHLSIDVREFTQNRGKVAVLNDVMSTVTSDIIMFTDVSSLISLDALRLAAERFQTPRIGAINGNYRLLNPGSDGEAMYWQYQSAIKIGEEKLGSVLGAHGACYFLRTHLFKQLPANCINDDFVIPMRAIEQGYTVAYEPRLNAVELEQSNSQMDWNRRLRISAGNFQQLILLYRLLNPSYRGICLAFLSGKALRVLMPICMLLCFLGSWFLYSSPFFLFIALCQSFIYGAVTVKHLCHLQNTSKYFNALDYLICGHAANFIGAMKYIYTAGYLRRR